MEQISNGTKTISQGGKREGQQLLYPNADITPSQQPMQGMGSESRGLREYPFFAHFRAAAGLER